MRVAGQDHVASPSERPTNARWKFDQPVVDPVDRVADPEPHVGGDLVVSAAGGVEFAAGVADPLDQRPLDVHVDVFEFGGR